MELLYSDAKKVELIKLKERSKMLTELDPLNGPKKYDLFWRKLEHYSDVDSLDYVWSNPLNIDLISKFRMLGIGTASELNEFIIRTRITDLERAESDKINMQIQSLNYEKTRILSKLDRNEIIDLMLMLGLVSSISVFGLRYAYYIISWCTRVLFTE